MAIKKVKLTEADLNRIVRKVVNEAPRMRAVVNPKIKALAAYLKQNNILPQELNAAISINKGATQQPAQPAQQQGGNFMNNIRQGIKTVQGYQQQGINKLSQGLNSVANAVKPKQQGGVAQAPRKTAPVAAKPTTPATGTTPVNPQKAQMTPEQLKAIQGQAKRV